ncbi:MAG TPA: glycosyltransferase family A protein [Candidatus Sulfotelmatobacter sp.]|nr:glycosyltransferase family A protein [Candidatus Sulfotelmatobacter sp.]
MSASVSVVIPVYGRFRLLKQVVESVLMQTYPVSEVILIDDGSPDETPQMLPRYIAENPAWRERVRYFHQENQGQSVARNNGIARARGEWLAFNDNDDLWLPQKLEWQFRALARYNGQCGLCFTDGWFMNNPRMKMTIFQLASATYEPQIGIVEDLVDFMEHLDQAWIQTVVARTDLVRQLGFDENVRYLEERDFLFRLALVTKFCYVNMPMALIDRSPAEQRHLGSSLAWHKEEFRLRMLQYRYEKNWRQIKGLEPNVKKFLRRRLREVHSSWTNRYLRFGDYGKARESVSEAAAYELTPGIALKWALTHIAPWAIRSALLLREQTESRQIGLDPMM